MQVAYENNLGESCIEPLYAIFIDERGVEYVVTRCWRECGPVIMRRDTPGLIIDNFGD